MMHLLLSPFEQNPPGVSLVLVYSTSHAIIGYLLESFTFQLNRTENRFCARHDIDFLFL